MIQPAHLEGKKIPICYFILRLIQSPNDELFRKFMWICIGIIHYQVPATIEVGDKYLKNAK